jgi:AraC-like DNA-binding protein
MASVQPLQAHPAFACAHVDGLAELVETALGANIDSMQSERDEIDARANLFSLPNSGLWFCSYGIPLRLRFPDNDYVRIQFHHSGVGASRIGDQVVPITKSQACVTTGEIAIDFGADFQQLVWRIPKETLVRKLASLTGGPVSRDLDFDLEVDLEKPDSALMLRMLGCLVHAAETVGGDAAQIVLGELEQTLITAFLTGTSRDFREHMQRPAPGLAPRQVRRAEGYIEENWDRPVSIDELASVVGASARSIFRAFKQSRGYTPQEFARQIRLKRARSMLMESPLSLTEIALHCGFSDSSHFSREYQRAFGQRPSELRREAERRRA